MLITKYCSSLPFYLPYALNQSLDLQLSQVCFHLQSVVKIIISCSQTQMTFDDFIISCRLEPQQIPTSEVCVSEDTQSDGVSEKKIWQPSKTDT